MKDIYQKEFHTMVCNLMEAESENSDFEMYKSVIGVVYSLLEDNKLEKLDETLRLHFPEYYSTPVPIVLTDN